MQCRKSNMDRACLTQTTSRLVVRFCEGYNIGSSQGFTCSVSFTNSSARELRIDSNDAFSSSPLCSAASCSSFVCLALSSFSSSSSRLACPACNAASSLIARYYCLLSDALRLSFSTDRLSCLCSVLRIVIWVSRTVMRDKIL